MQDKVYMQESQTSPMQIEIRATTGSRYLVLCFQSQITSKIVGIVALTYFVWLGFSVILINKAQTGKQIVE